MDSPKAPDPKIVALLAKVITGFGERYNHFQLRGLEHVPRTGPALIVLYHGLVPLDFWYLGLKIYTETGRLPRALGDRWLFKVPGLEWLCRNVGAVEASPEMALRILQQGELVGVSPGGVREAISGTKNNYRLQWGQRQGFAKLAIQAGVKIIPGFTQNVEGLYHAPLASLPTFQNLYEKTRLPLVPIVGLGLLPFPVHLTTWLDTPIVPQPGETPTALVLRTKMAIEKLIETHQKSPKPN